MVVTATCEFLYIKHWRKIYLNKWALKNELKFISVKSDPEFVRYASAGVHWLTDWCLI